jgi:hypothetical protein
METPRHLKRRPTPVLLLVLSALSATGCGPSGTSAETGSAPRATAPQIKIRTADGREVRDGDPNAHGRRQRQGRGRTPRPAR